MGMVPVLRIVTSRVGQFLSPNCVAKLGDDGVAVSPNAPMFTSVVEEMDGAWLDVALTVMTLAVSLSATLKKPP